MVFSAYQELGRGNSILHILRETNDKVLLTLCVLLQNQGFRQQVLESDYEKSMSSGFYRYEVSLNQRRFDAVLVAGNNALRLLVIANMTSDLRLHTLARCVTCGRKMSHDVVSTSTNQV